MSPESTRIFLVRHGETEWNQTRRAQGQVDVPLNETGHKQAQHVCEELYDARVDAVFSSDLSRAVDTARPLAESRGLPVIEDPAWREVDQGEWEGLGNEEIRRRWPEQWDPEQRWSVARPGGESPRQVLDRATDALRRILEANPGGHIVVVTHGGVIRWLSAEILGLGIEGSGRVRGLSNGGVVEFEALLEDGRIKFGDLVRMDGADTSLSDPNA